MKLNKERYKSNISSIFNYDIKENVNIKSNNKGNNNYDLRKQLLNIKKNNNKTNLKNYILNQDDLRYKTNKNNTYTSCLFKTLDFNNNNNNKNNKNDSIKKEFINKYVTTNNNNNKCFSLNKYIIYNNKNKNKNNKISNKDKYLNKSFVTSKSNILNGNNILSFLASKKNSIGKITNLNPKLVSERTKNMPITNTIKTFNHFKDHKSKVLFYK